MGDTNSSERVLSPKELETMEEFIHLAKQAPMRPAIAPANDQQDEIDLVELFWYLLSQVKILIIVALIGGMLGGLFGYNFVKPVYSATAKLYIIGEGTSIQLTNLQLGSLLRDDYKEVFKTWEVHEMVRQSLNLPYNYTQMANMVSISSPDNSRVLYVTAKNTDPMLAADIANEYVLAAQQFILQTMDSEKPSVFSTALIPTNPINHGGAYYMMLGLLLGLLAPCAVFTVIFLTDDRPASVDALEKFTGLSTIGVIPEADSQKKKPAAKKR